MQNIFKKNHFNAIIFKSYIKYIEDNFKDIDIEKKLKSVGLSKEYFNSSSNWISLEFNEFLISTLKERNNQKFRFEVGKFSASKEGLGAALYYMLKNTITWEAGAKMLPKMNALFNKVVNVKVVSVNKNQAIWHFTPVFDNLNNYEKNILINTFDDIIDNSIGYYVGVAELKKIRNLKYEVLKLKNQLGYEVTFYYKMQRDISWLKKSIFLPLLSFSFLPFIFSNNSILNTIISIVIAGLSLGVLYFYTQNEQIKEFIESAKQNIFELDEKNKSLNEAQIKLERKLTESNAAYTIITKIASVHSIEEMFRITLTSVCDSLNYDEGSVYLINKNLQKFEELLVYRNKEIKRNEISKVIEVHEIEKVFSENSANLVSFPIHFNNEIQAVIIFEVYEKGKCFSEEDLLFCKSITLQLENAFEIHQAKQMLIDSYQNEIQISQAYSRFVPHEILNMLNYKKISDVKIGDCVEVDLAIMFCDMWNFTSMCEDMSSKDVLGLLNSYYSRIAPVIKSNNGTIDKYMGDGLMAIFPTLKDSVKASSEIQIEIMKYNIKERLNERTPLRVGIGLSFGRVVFAPLGFESRLELTAISDVVNIASRLDQQCRTHDAYIMVSCLNENDITNQNELICYKHGELSVKGKKRTVNSYELVLDIEKIKDILIMCENQKKKDYLESILNNCKNKLSKIDRKLAS